VDGYKIRRPNRSLCTLINSGIHTNELQRGCWRFVSHPAQLCALSLLHTLADPRQKLFPTDFWQTAGVGDSEKLQQKEVLEALEDRRKAHHLDGEATPIRFIYVAWGLIKLNDKILFHERETKEHRHEFGLIGGRVNLKDLRHVMGDACPLQETLAALQSPDSPSMFEAMPYALSREFEEETGLLRGEHYMAEPWRDLEPWQDCMGGAPNYALTRYFFRLYRIRLTTPGFLALRKTLKDQKTELLECTLDEVAQGKTQGGSKTLRIEAIYDDFKKDREALKVALQALPSSYDNCYRYTDDRDALILSLENDIRRGDGGFEKALPISLSPEQKALLMGFAAHGKGFPIETAPDAGLTFHDYGWVEIHDAGLLEAVIELSELFRQANLPYIEMTDQRYARLSLPANLVFFDPVFFACSLQESAESSGATFTLYRSQLATTFGIVKAEQRSKTLTRKNNRLIKQLKDLLRKNKISVNEDSGRESIRKTFRDVHLSLGLRALLCIKVQDYQFTCKCLS